MFTFSPMDFSNTITCKCSSNSFIMREMIFMNIPISGGDSECESNDEPVVGNVNKFAVVPPGYQGPPKRGHVVFDACFEGG